MAVTVTPSKRRHQLEMGELLARQRIELVNLRETHRQQRAELRKAQKTGRPSARAGSTELGARESGVVLTIRNAYQRLAMKTRSPSVVIADLATESGIPVPVLHRWILEEMRAGRASPALGEPTLATPAQLRGALTFEGRPHLYVELHP